MAYNYWDNNNPGNIGYFGLPGQTGGTGWDTGHKIATYATLDDGFNAMSRLALGKYHRGATTLNSLIAGAGGWTPGNSAAAANIAKYMGIQPDQDLNLTDPGMMRRFQRALNMQETGSTKQYDTWVGGQPSVGEGTPGDLVKGTAAPLFAARGTNTRPEAPGSIDPEIIARGGVSPSIPTTPAAATPGTTINTASAAGVVIPGFGTKEASDAFRKNLGDFDKALGGRGLDDGQQGDQGPPKAPPLVLQMNARNYPGPAGVEAQARQLSPQITGYSPGLYGHSLDSQPLAWSNQPVPAPAWARNAGLQQPQGQPGIGTSLNSMDPQMLAMLYGSGGGGSFGGG